MHAPLILSKLRPPRVRPDVVARPALVGRIEQGRALGAQLTLISAPAGSGKSTLVGAWATSAERLAWLSLDDDDDDPARFWTYLLGALQRAMPGLGEGALDVLRSPQPPPIQTWLTPLLNEWAEREDPAMLVLDDLHLVESPRVHEGLAFLLEHLPVEGHVVIATRADPPLPLPRMRVRRQLTEIRDADLRLSDDEAAALLSALSVDLGPEQVAALQERTEGWAAGLQLAAISLQGHAEPAAFVEAFSGSHHHVLDYLLEEVLGQQDAGVQRFLIETSVLTRFDRDLADAATGRPGSAGMIERLLRANLFVVPLDAEHREVRYHHLFGQLLRSRLAEEGPILRRAAEWCHSQGRTAEGVRYAREAGDMDLAAELIIASAFELMTRGELATLAGWMQGLPSERVEARPWLLVLKAWVHLVTGEGRKIGEALARAGELLAEGHADADDPEIQGNIDVLSAIVANIMGDTGRALELALRARESLPADCLVVQSMVPSIVGNAARAEGELGQAIAAFGEVHDIGERFGNRWTQTIALCEQAQVRMVEGRYREALTLHRAAQELAKAPSVRETALGAIADLGLGWMVYLRGDVDEAWQIAEQAVPRLLPAGSPHQLQFGLSVRAQIAGARGESAEADWARAVALVRESPPSAPALGVALDFPLLRYWLSHGRAEEARAWVEERRLGREGPPVSREGGAIAAARVTMERDARAAVEALGPLAAGAHAAGRGGRAAFATILLALAHGRLGDTGAALKRLTPVLGWIDQEGVVRLLADEGEPMARLLRAGRWRGAAKSVAERVLEAMAAIPRAGDRANAALAEPLSERELEVLTLLAEGLSNRALAQRLFVSVGTIKTHVHHITRKLDADNRLHAVARARELGLLEG